MSFKPKTITTWLKTSAWVFPILLLVPLILLTAFKINGSSIGVYHKFFYGDTKQDENLIFGTPRPIRSDEWLVNTQKSVAQSQTNYQRVNPNVGEGEDISVIYDAPYKEWSSVFKPHNWAFIVLPFDNAFAFKWWIMGYLFVVGCYFFVLALLPKQRMLAAMFAVAVFFSPFIQWWYQYATLAPLYYSFLIAVIVMRMIKATELRTIIIFGIGLSYLLTAFSLILYPPFQIACALVLAVFLLGYLIENKRLLSKVFLLKNGAVALTAVLVAVATVLIFFATRSEVISAIQNTVYPGHRVAVGGDYDVAHLFSSHLSTNFQLTRRAANYHAGGGVLATTNQSESSNFILLVPFLVLPALVLIYKNYKNRRKLDWPLLLITGLLGLLLLRLLTPYFQSIFSLLLLDKVPGKRLIIGVGLLGFFYTVLFMRNLVHYKRFPLQRAWLVSYSALIFVVEVMLGVYAAYRSPGFIDIWLVVLLSVPIPLIIYLFLNKRFGWALITFLLFSMLSGAGVNPLYRGTSILSNNELSEAIKTISSANTGRWAAENIYFENMAGNNGAATITGVYVHPQPNIWDDIPGVKSEIFNRYAHTSVVIDRNPSLIIPTQLILVAPDSFVVQTEVCAQFFREWNVRYLITSQPLSPNDSCAQLEKTFSYPSVEAYIYKFQ